jgi:CheY-like chemotaxis protein
LITRHDIGIILFSIHNIPGEERSRLMALCSKTLARVVVAPDILANLWERPGTYDGRSGVVEPNRESAGQATARATLNTPSVSTGQSASRDEDSMRLLIVDDSAVIRERLVTQLKEITGVDIVGQAESLAQAIGALRQLKPDVMTLDLRLPDGNGLDVLRLIQRERLPTVVIVLTSYSYPQYDKRARASGAYAFLNKNRDFAMIPELLRALMPGGPQPVPGEAA